VFLLMSSVIRRTVQNFEVPNRIAFFNQNRTDSEPILWFLETEPKVKNQFRRPLLLRGSSFEIVGLITETSFAKVGGVRERLISGGHNVARLWRMCSSSNNMPICSTVCKYAGWLLIFCVLQKCILE